MKALMNTDVEEIEKWPQENAEEGNKADSSGRPATAS
jgi:hypothetical protein